jgi:putative SOS response-associated peptidase YedK
MCGRYVRAGAAIEYVVPLMGRHDTRVPVEDRPGWNIGPSRHAAVFWGDGAVLHTRWGYLPRWASSKGLKPMINATSEKWSSSAWKGLWNSGRVIVPADGWYEWIIGSDGGKQPYFIRRRDVAPLYLAGLSSAGPGRDPRDGDGFVLVTSAATGGMVDIHDRRPVVFDVDGARAWIDAGVLADGAAQIAHDAALPVERFEWFTVSRAVNRMENDGPALIEPVEAL